MTVTEKIRTTLKTVKEYKIIVVAIAITIVLYLPKIVPVPIPLPNSYPVKSPSMSVAIKAFKTKNYDIALSHFLGLAEAGDPLAQLMAGTMYKAGVGIKRDLCQFTYWMDKAARQGDFNAQLQLSDAYSLSIAINYDMDKAYLWLKAAKINLNQDSSIIWYKDVTGLESDRAALFKMLENLNTEANRNKLDQNFTTWNYSAEPPVHVIRIRDIPYINGASIVTPSVKPCY